jgi:hypothetical protein
MPRAPFLTEQRRDEQGEIHLARAILAQAYKDLHSPWAVVRAEADRFWSDPHSVRLWADVVDVDVEVLAQAVARRREA